MNMHWYEMNITKNKNITLQPDSFFVSKEEPNDYILDKDLVCKVFTESFLSSDIFEKIMNFINVHNRTETGNIVQINKEIFERYLSTNFVISVLFHQEEIVGTIFSVVFGIQVNNKLDISTSYTTFLCVHKDHRKKNYPMILIRSNIKELYHKYNSLCSYYICNNTHHDVYNTMKLWYRPINIKNAENGGFILHEFPDTKHFSSSKRKRMAYNIPKPRNIPKKANDEDYDKVLKLLKTGKIYLNPTLSEYKCLCKCFDIYIVENKGVFFLFPLYMYVKKPVKNVQLSLMTGDIIDSVLWIAKESNYDLLCGWFSGNINKDMIDKIKGLTASSDLFLEFYNFQKTIPNNLFFVPFF
jgi:hypothetical protein